MARFIFRLEPLLEQRRHVERERQRRVAEIQRQVNDLLGKIRTAQQTIAEEDHALAGVHLIGRLDLAYIAHEKRYVGTLQVLIQQHMQRVAALQGAMVEARAALLKAAQARQAMEKLRDKQRARWQAEQDRKENAALDEISAQLSVRRLIAPEDSGMATLAGRGDDDHESS